MGKTHDDVYERGFKAGKAGGSMFCKSCGANLPDDANFCMKCGVGLRGTVQDERTLFESTMQKLSVHDGESWENVTLIVTNKKVRVIGGGHTADTPLAHIRFVQTIKGGWFDPTGWEL